MNDQEEAPNRVAKRKITGWHQGKIGTGWPNRGCQDGIRERLGQDGQIEDGRMASGKDWDRMAK